MKLHPAFVFSVAVLTAPAALTAADFEGKVRMKITDPKSGAHTLDYSIKEGLVRTDIATANDQTATVIMELAKQDMIMLIPGQSMYMVMPMKQITDRMDKSAVAATSESTLEKTGETETILGYHCVKYISHAKDMTTEMWVTDELGNFYGLSRGMSGMGRPSTPPAWEKALAGRGFFPLRVVGVAAGGKEKFRLETLSVEKQSLPDSDFAPPPGYQKFDMGGMMQGLGGFKPPGS